MRSRNQRKGSVVAGDDRIINDAANKFLAQSLKEHPPTREGVDTLFRKVSDEFVKYDPLQVNGEHKPEKPPPVTTTTWFKSSSTELYKLVTVKPSLLPDTGYGLFAERKFKVGDIV